MAFNFKDQMSHEIFELKEGEEYIKLDVSRAIEVLKELKDKGEISTNDFLLVNDDLLGIKPLIEEIGERASDIQKRLKLAEVM